MTTPIKAISCLAEVEVDEKVTPSKQNRFKGPPAKTPAIVLSLENLSSVFSLQRLSSTSSSFPNAFAPSF